MAVERKERKRKKKKKRIFPKSAHSIDIVILEMSGSTRTAKWCPIFKLSSITRCICPSNVRFAGLTRPLAIYGNHGFDPYVPVILVSATWIQSTVSIYIYVYMPIMPLVLATPCDLSVTVKSIEVRLLLKGGNFHHKVNSIIYLQNRPLF